MCRKLGIRVAFFSCNLLYCIKYKNLNIAEETDTTQEGHLGGSRPRGVRLHGERGGTGPHGSGRAVGSAENLEGGNRKKETPVNGPAFKCHVPISEQPNVNFYDKNVN